MTILKAARAVEIDEEERELRVVASDESVDRYGDVIRARGWSLKQFRKNPVLLFSHDSRSPPIGTVRDIAVEEDRLVATAKFLPEGTYDFADLIWRIWKAGALRAVSVGFLPLDPPTPMLDEEKRITGFEFKKQELLELSVVPVPANPNALSLARSLGLSDETTYRLFGGVGEAPPSPSPALSARDIDASEEPTPQAGARDSQGVRAFSRDLLNWEIEKMRRTLRAQGII